jgi:hypothetical protein
VWQYFTDTVIFAKLGVTVGPGTTGRTWGECSRTGYRAECLGLRRRKEQKAGENCRKELHDLYSSSNTHYKGDRNSEGELGGGI